MYTPLKLQNEIVIDSHAHIGGWYDYYVTQWDNARGMVEIMDVIGIDSAVVSGFPALHGNVTYGNDLVAKAMADFTGRFFGFAAINPNYPDNMLPELERCRKAGFVGIKLHADGQLEDWQGIKAVTEKLYPVYEFAQENKLIVLAHTFGTPQHLEELAKAHPAVTFIIGHGSEIFWSGPGRWETVVRDQPNVYISLSTTFRSGHIKIMVQEIGVEKLLYGSDMTYLDPGFGLGPIIFADIRDEDKRKILGLNFQSIIERRK